MIAGQGRKRPQLNIPIEYLHLDKDNPRLPEEAQGKDEQDLLSVLYKGFNLDELAESMAKNGYFDEEPLVAIPAALPVEMIDVAPDDKGYFAFLKNEGTEFIVVEGNRRLATAKLLLDTQLRETLNIKSWPEIDEAVAKDLKILPVIVYATRSEVIPYLGVRHIIGIQKWNSYAKARYIAKMVESGKTVKQVEEQIGDRQSSVRKNYLSYKLLEQAHDEFDYDTKQAKADFSLLTLALGQGNIKRFIGLPKRLADSNPDEPVPRDKIPNLKSLVSWIFGDNKDGPVIDESRDITSYLSHVVESPEAIAYLERTRRLLEAYDRTDGEEKMIIKYLITANTKLEGALGIAHRHKTDEVIVEAEKCAKTASRLVKTLRETDD